MRNRPALSFDDVFNQDRGESFRIEESTAEIDAVLNS